MNAFRVLSKARLDAPVVSGYAQETNESCNFIPRVTFVLCSEASTGKKLLVWSGAFLVHFCICLRCVMRTTPMSLLVFAQERLYGVCILSVQPAPAFRFFREPPTYESQSTEARTSLKCFPRAGFGFFTDGESNL